MSLPNEPGVWWKDGRPFFASRQPGDDRLWVRVLDAQGLAVASPVTNWEQDGWVKSESPEQVSYLIDERNSHRDRALNLESELDDLKSLVKQIDKTLRVPAAEYVPAISDVFSLIDGAGL